MVVATLQWVTTRTTPTTRHLTFGVSMCLIYTQAPWQRKQTWHRKQWSEEERERERPWNKKKETSWWSCTVHVCTCTWCTWRIKHSSSNSNNNDNNNNDDNDNKRLPGGQCNTTHWSDAIVGGGWWERKREREKKREVFQLFATFIRVNSFHSLSLPLYNRSSI